MAIFISVRVRPHIYPYHLERWFSSWIIVDAALSGVSAPKGPLPVRKNTTCIVLLCVVLLSPPQPEPVRHRPPPHITHQHASFAQRLPPFRPTVGPSTASARVPPDPVLPLLTALELDDLIRAESHYWFWSHIANRDAGYTPRHEHPGYNYEFVTRGNPPCHHTYCQSGRVAVVVRSFLQVGI